MPLATVLTIEDDAAIRRGLVDALEFAGYSALQAGDGPAGCRMALTRAYDLLLLDMVLPGKPGLEILRELRAVKPTLPVIILSARGEEADRVRGLELGADDYVVKPFSVKELLARVSAVLRRSPGRPTDLARLEFAGGAVDFNRCEVLHDDGRRSEITSREAELLRYLAQNCGRVVSRDEILTSVWQIDGRGLSTRAIDMQIARLREKLGAVELLETVRGKGYRWAAPGGRQPVR